MNDSSLTLKLKNLVKKETFVVKKETFSRRGTKLAVTRKESSIIMPIQPLIMPESVMSDRRD